MLNPLDVRSKSQEIQDQIPNKDVCRACSYEIGPFRHFMGQAIGVGFDMNSAINEHEETPLHVCVGQDKEQNLRHLIELGANLEVVDADGCTPLICANINGQDSMVRMLLESAANVHKAGMRNRTALHWAASNGKTELCVLMMNAGADPHAVDAEGCNAIQVAGNAGEPETALAISAYVSSTLARMAIDQAIQEVRAGIPFESFVGSPAKLKGPA